MTLAQIQRQFSYPSPLPDITLLATVGLFVAILYSAARHLYQRQLATPLGGPPRKNLLNGYYSDYALADDPASVIRQWSNTHGTVFKVPWALGTHRVFICDPKAVAHFYANDSYKYLQSPVFVKSAAVTFGANSVLTVEKDVHRRQRKALGPSFAPRVIKAIFPDLKLCAFKVHSAWGELVDLDGAAVVDVQRWMSYLTFDSIGMAGFSHNFGCLDGQEPEVFKLLESAGLMMTPEIEAVGGLLSPLIPLVMKLPLKELNDLAKVKAALTQVARDLLQQSKSERGDELEGKTLEKSIIGIIMNSEKAASGSHLSEEEIICQMNTLLLAGYITTTATLTWALIELSRHPEHQDTLRNELLSGPTIETYDQLTTSFPFLDAVTHETLRMHPPVPDTARVASEDDVIPLSEPITTLTGQVVDNITITKGTPIVAPVAYLNQSELIWGADAADFNPNRWLKSDINGTSGPSRGYRNIFTFADGPRLCLGKTLAVTELKLALATLLKSFTFEFPEKEGVRTKIVRHRAMVYRPKVQGEDGPKVPLLIRRASA